MIMLRCGGKGGGRGLKFCLVGVENIVVRIVIEDDLSHNILIEHIDNKTHDRQPKSMAFENVHDLAENGNRAEQCRMIGPDAIHGQ